jgi:type VI protein secretion system component Hcp
MLKLAKHAVAIVVVVAAASAPVAAHAESLSLNYTQVAVTHAVQDDRSSTAVQPR